MITKPIIFGNKSSYFGKKRESDGHTHSWTCYFKSFNNEVFHCTVVVRPDSHDYYQIILRFDNNYVFRICLHILRKCSLNYTKAMLTLPEV